LAPYVRHAGPPASGNALVPTNLPRGGSSVTKNPLCPQGQATEPGARGVNLDKKSLLPCRNHREMKRLWETTQTENRAGRSSTALAGNRPKRRKNSDDKPGQMEIVKLWLAVHLGKGKFQAQTHADLRRRKMSAFWAG
jgi:hypothetical protein